MRARVSLCVATHTDVSFLLTYLSNTWLWFMLSGILTQHNALLPRLNALFINRVPALNAAGEHF